MDGMGKMILLLIVLPLFSCAEDLELGVHHDNKGHAFCISFMQNGPPDSAILKLHILTDELEAVQVNIRYKTLTGNMTSMITSVSRDSSPTTVIVPFDLAISPSTLTSNAISIRTSDASKSIAIICQNAHQSNITNSAYLALPIIQYENIYSYQYSHFSDLPSQDDDYSMFVLSNCADNDIVPSLQSPPSLSRVMQVPDIYRQFVDSRTFIENRPTPLRRIETFESLHFENSSIDVSGIRTSSDRAFGFFSGITCSSDNCNPLSLQIPPSYTWGYTFVTNPQIGNTLSFIEIKALPVYDMTLLSFYCNDNTNGSVIVTYEGYSINLPNQTLCSFISDRPIGLVQILHGDTNGVRTMMWLPPMEQFVEEVTFVSGLLDNNFHSGNEEFALVTVPSLKFDASLIFLDGNVFLASKDSWNAVMCSAVEVCAYSVVTQLPNGKHIFRHDGTSGQLSVSVISTSVNMSSYSTGFRMDPIGVPVVSFTKSLYVGSESISPNITLTRSGDVMVALDIIIKITSIPHPDALPINMDFHSFNETVHFDVGEREREMVLHVNDDLRVESAENFTLSLMATTVPGPFAMSSVFLPLDTAILQIHDNDLLVLGFTLETMQVSEELESVALFLRSSVPLQDSGMNVIIRTRPGTASDTLDYTRLDDRLFLHPGESEWRITATIVDDDRVENMEYFFVTVEVISSAVDPTLAINEVQINITDIDNTNIYFAEISTRVIEEGVAQIMLKKEGANDFPVEVNISTEDIVARAGIDYEKIQNMKITFESEETEKFFNLTIMSDTVLELDETLNLRLSSETDARVDFNRGTRQLVSITDDDVVEIGFSQALFPVVEGDGVAVLTVEVIGMAERSFLFHVETFQQQARAGVDFVQLDNDLEFPSLQSSYQFNVTILDNKIAEASSEGFTVSLTSSPSDDIAVTVLRSSRTTVVTIKEDDNVLIAMDLVNPMLVGREGGPDLHIRLYKTGDIVAVVPVTVALHALMPPLSTADVSIDFTLDSDITFAPNENEKNASIQLLPDSVNENTETINIVLIPLFGPVSVDLSQELNVLILDTSTPSVEFSSLNYTVSEGEYAMLTLIVRGSLENNISVILTTAQGTANDIDFSPLYGETLMIPSGVSQVPISIQTIEDDIFENDETFTLSIQLSEGIIGSRSSAIVTISDDEELSISMVENSFHVLESVGNVTVPIYITGTSAIDVPILLAINDQSTQGRQDYRQFTDSLVIPAGVSVFNISILIVNDEIVENQQEMFLLMVESFHPRVIVSDNNSTAVITISDDDVLMVEFEKSTYTIAEDSSEPLVISLNSRGQTEIPLFITVMTDNGTAIGGEDYSMLNQLLMFNQTITEHLLVIDIINDRILEGTQTFFVNLETASEFIVFSSTGFQAMIEIHDGVTSEVSIEVSSLLNVVLENTGQAIFNISILGRRETNVFVTFETKSGSATAYDDYLPVQTTVFFSEEDTYSLVSVVLIDDNRSERRKSFYGTIRSNHSAITLTTNKSQVIIKDDEGAVINLERDLYVVNEGETVIINVVRSVDIMDDIELNVSSMNILAEEGTDFMIKSNNVTVQSGEVLTKIATVNTIADGLYENLHETFEVAISLVASGTNDGAVLINHTAVVSITDTDALLFTGVNVVVNELNSTSEVCFSSNIPSIAPIQLQFTYLSSTINGAEVNVDYNITETHITIFPSIQESPSFCIPLMIIHDQDQEPDEHLCLMTTSNDSRVSISPDTTTEYCPSNMITVTITNADVHVPEASPVCYLEDSMIVIPFPKPLSQPLTYTYHGNCEHVLLQHCSTKPEFTINTDHNPDDLSVSRIAVRVNNSYIVFNTEDFTYSTSGFVTEESISRIEKLYDRSLLIEYNNTASFFKIDILNFGIVVEFITNDGNSTVIVNATKYTEGDNGVCGLCGTADGILLYSDQTTQLSTRTTKSIEDFARSWLVNPEDQITRDSGRECGILGNDSVVGDPLYSVPIYPLNSSLMSLSLCFEVHGVSNKVFNLVSDRCVSVNGLYSSMNNPNDGNIITSVGVNAVDNAGSCIQIAVNLSNQCIPMVNSNFVSFYSEYGVSVRKHGNKVIISVPNCENEQLVMWLMCRTIEQQRMLDFKIQRGLNLRPSSHGLLGQFWNVPVQLTSYHTELPDQIKDYYDADKLYLVTVQDPLSLNKKRQFIGELFKRSWDKSLTSCLYVGSSQGGILADVPGPKDSVIEGVYTRYIIEDGLLGTDFAFSRFDSAVCNN